MRTSKLFFALWPDDKTRLALARLGRSLEIEGYKTVPPYNFHVTLLFIGHVDEASELLIKESVNSITAEPFLITFDRLSYWINPKVLCLTCRQPAQQIMALAQRLNDAVTNVGLATDAKPYNPHVTLARHVSSFVERDCDPLVWRAESFCLVESCSSIDGVIYQVKNQWPFVKT